MKKRTKIVFLVALPLFFLGLAIAVYPVYHGRKLDQAMTERAENFLSLHKAKETATSDGDETRKISGLAYADLWADAVAYNARIYEENQLGFDSEEAYRKPSFRLADYGLDSEIFAVLSIPRLSLKMPIYLGASNDHLALGAAHMSQTSLPIGGENTNCVLAGHRGWKGGEYFRHLVQLKPGDEVIITNLWETLNYTVTKTDIIAHNETDKLRIQPGKDMLTLFTCDYTPTGKVRFVVYCERN